MAKKNIGVKEKQKESIEKNNENIEFFSINNKTIMNEKDYNVFENNITVKKFKKLNEEKEESISSLNNIDYESELRSIIKARLSSELEVATEDEKELILKKIKAINTDQVALMNYSIYDGYLQHPIDYNQILINRASNPVYCNALSKLASLAFGNGIKVEINKERTKLKKQELKKVIEDIEDFMENPNDSMDTFNTILRENIINYVDTGNSGFEIIKTLNRKSTGNKYVITLYNANFSRSFYIKPKIMNNDKNLIRVGEVECYKQILNSLSFNTPLFYPLEKNMVTGKRYLLHLRQQNSIDPFYGIPNHISSEKKLTNNSLIEAFSMNYFNNYASPSFILALAGTLWNKNELSNFKKQVEDIKATSSMQGRTVILDLPSESATVKLIEVTGKLDKSHLDLKQENDMDIVRSTELPFKIVDVGRDGSALSGNENFGALLIARALVLNSIQKFYTEKLEKMFNIMFGVKVTVTFKNPRLMNEKDEAVLFSILNGIQDENGMPVATAKEIRNMLGMPEEPVGALNAKKNQSNSNPNQNGDSNSNQIETDSNGDITNNLDSNSTEITNSDIN